MIKLGKYKHFKGSIYEVINIAQHTETDEQLVIYKNEANQVFARPMNMFISKVDKHKYPEVDQKYRFEFIKDSK